MIIWSVERFVEPRVDTRIMRSSSAGGVSEGWAVSKYFENHGFGTV